MATDQAAVCNELEWRMCWLLYANDLLLYVSNLAHCLPPALFVKLWIQAESSWEQASPTSNKKEKACKYSKRQMKGVAEEQRDVRKEGGKEQ